MTLLAQQVGLDIFKIVYDSKALQFWGSELYKRGVTLNSVPARLRDSWKARAIFTRAEIARYARRARTLNKEGKGDQAVFYMKRTGTGGTQGDF